MRLTITFDHREFFNKNHYIEFEGIISPDQAAALKKECEEVIAKRLQLTPARLHQCPAPQIYQAGYDLWRDSGSIKKSTQKNTFASLASELTQVLPIRYGFDQYFATTKCTVSAYDVPLSLQEISSMKPLACGLLLALNDLAAPPSFFPMPLKTGSGLFISPSFALPWPQLFSTPGLSFLLIAYAQQKTFFCADTRDPHAVSLKKLGYVFNDLLKDSLHPILHRK